MATTKIEASNIAAGAVASTGFTSVQVFTAASTWTRPTDITKVIVEVQGAGGSGAKRLSAGQYGVSGAGGGYAKKFLDVSNTTTATVTIGAGGAAQTTGNTAGTAGGLSKFEENAGSGGWTDVIGNGGAAGGEAVAYATSTGGTGTGGDINIQGQYGTGGGASDRSGSSMLGLGNKMVQTGQTTVVPSTGYGAGGGGGLNVDSTAGTPGIIIVWEYK